MNFKNRKCLILIAHAIGITIGIVSSLSFYCLVKPISHRKNINKKLKKAFKNIDCKIDI